VADGASCNGLSSAIDLAPTICEALGVELPSWNEGVSLLPMLQGQAETVRDSCCIEYRNGYGEKDIASRTLVTDRYKYTRYETHDEELTDLQDDPTESINLALKPEQQDVRMDMRTALLDASLSIKSRHPEQISHA
jgi:arylsulfatase A-like enzyme